MGKDATLLKRLGVFVLLCSLIAMLESCVSVAAYQKMYLNDADMKLEHRKAEYFEINMAAYREGAAGMNGGKSGGGCGCN